MITSSAIWTSFCRTVYVVSLSVGSRTAALAETSANPRKLTDPFVNLRLALTVFRFAIALPPSRRARAGSSGCSPPHAASSNTTRAHAQKDPSLVVISHQYQPRVRPVCDVPKSIGPFLSRSQDQTDRPVVEEVVPGPVHQHDDAAAEADDVDEVDEEPHQPPQESGQTHRPELRHRRVAADGGHDSGVLEPEVGRAVPTQQILDGGRHLTALLHRDGNEHWQKGIAVDSAGEITDYEHVRM